jgi:hypothetical protein
MFSFSNIPLQIWIHTCYTVDMFTGIVTEMFLKV